MVTGSSETLTEAYRRARMELSAQARQTDEVTTSRIALESRELVCAAAGLPRDQFYTRPDTPVDSARLDSLLNRRKSGEPLAYCLGEWDFEGFSFRTDRRALIPRDDSAATLDLFLTHLPSNPSELTLLDLCTGSGCLGIASALRLRERGQRARVVLADNSEAALQLAQENVERFGLQDCVTVCPADLFALDQWDLSALPFSFDGFDGCICNPPYIDREELAELDREVLAFEPLSALFGGEDGLDFYRSGITQIPPLLRTGGVLTFEVGYAQAGAVAALFLVSGFEDIRFENDLQKISRAVSARKCAPLSEIPQSDAC